LKVSCAAAFSTRHLLAFDAIPKIAIAAPAAMAKNMSRYMAMRDWPAEENMQKDI